MIKKIISLLSAAIILSSIFSISSSANSAQTWWKGTDASGVIVTDDESPVIVKNEVLTFNIDSFPENYYRSEYEMKSYTASVTAQYTFYNPSDYDVTARLLFPFGEKPMYFYEYYDNEKDEYVDFDDTEKYEIILNGEPVEKKLRFTLNGGEFDTETAVGKIIDEFTKDNFYYPEMPVKKYTFTVSGIDTDKYHAATAAFDIETDSSDTRYYFVNQSGLHTQKDGTSRISNWVKNGDTLTVYILGNTKRDFPEWSFYEDGGVDDREKIDGKMTVKDVSLMTFYDLAFSQYREESKIPETDWYNAVVEKFNTNKNLLGAENSLNIEKDLLRWYEYEITVPAKSEVINAVNAPVYPVIDTNYSPAVYDYTYLLSPAKTWASFGELKIKINTPHYLVNSDGFSFSETDTGYELTFSGLPEHELEFRMSTSENPVKPKKSLTDILPVEIIIMLSVIMIIAVLAIILSVIVVKIYKKRKKIKTLK